MSYYATYTSSTLAAGGAQSHVSQETPVTGRIYYKLFAEGTANYSLLFTNTIDSTFADGSYSSANMPGGTWEILSASVGLVDTCSAEDTPDPSVSIPLTFDGQSGKLVLPNEVFASDPISLSVHAGQYLCFEVTYFGEDIPCHPESILPAFSKEAESWKRNTSILFPSLIGCDRLVRARIAYLGDSITQGIGTNVNSYENWCAVLSETLGNEYAFWNLGLGYGRAADAASDGAWLAKAKQNDAVVVCYGVNDILQGRTAEQLMEDLSTIVHKLHNAGVKVLLQAIPPFDYNGAAITTWNTVNDFIRNTLSKEADAFFDQVPCLCVSAEESHRTIYGGHPNAEGCSVWAKGLEPVMRAFLKTL